jgi:hypothetical protein
MVNAPPKDPATTAGRWSLEFPQTPDSYGVRRMFPTIFRAVLTVWNW